MEYLSSSFELKSVSDEGEFAGLAAVYTSVDSGGDSIVPGAFKSFDLTPDGFIRVLDGHDVTRAIGKGKLRDSPEGLRIEARLNLKISAAMDCYQRLRDGLISGLSIGYSTLSGGASYKDGVRYLTGIRLHEISTVAFPMHRLAQVSHVKSFGECNTIGEFEDTLRHALRLSGRESKKLASVGWQALHETEEPDMTALVTKLNSFNQILKRHTK